MTEVEMMILTASAGCLVIATYLNIKVGKKLWDIRKLSKKVDKNLAASAKNLENSMKNLEKSRKIMEIPQTE